MIKNALVTGCNGYLGSHLCKVLKKSGWIVVGIDYSIKNPHKYVDYFFECDVRNNEQVNKILRLLPISCVFHLAGRIEVGLSQKEPEEFYDINVGGTCTLVNAMVKNNVKNIVYSSSAAVYRQSGLPISEVDPIEINSVYGHTKYLSEEIIKKSRLNSVIFRYFNLAGADSEGELGETHEPETHLIPLMIRNNHHFIINGDDYFTPDGTCVRDYVHVMDVAEIHEKAALHLIDKNESLILNLGSGVGYSNLKMIEVLEKEVDVKVKYTFGPRRDGDAESLVADIDKARDVLNFEPKRDIVEIIRSAYNWEKNNEKIFGNRSQ